MSAYRYSSSARRHRTPALPVGVDANVLAHMATVETATAREIRAILWPHTMSDVAPRASLKRLRDKGLIVAVRPAVGAYGTWKDNGGAVFAINQAGRDALAEGAS